MKRTYGFPIMHKLIPEGKEGNWSIIHKIATEKDVRDMQLRDLINRRWYYSGFEPGIYTILRNGGRIVSSDTWLERYTQRKIVEKANGRVLIAGLGIGLVLLPICRKKEVKKVITVEIAPEVIKLVSLYIKHRKLTIIQGDIFEYKPEGKFDTIYFDIWESICGDNYEEIKILHKKFKYILNRKNPNCFMTSWMRDEVKRLARD